MDDSRTAAPSVATALEVLAAEIELASARCLTLDRVLGEVLERLPAEHRGRLLPELHGVDLLVQHLAGLSAFARGVGAAATPTMTVAVDAALSEITLGALAERMAAGMACGRRLCGRTPSDGEVDLF
jgi:hypothetical protein